MVIVPMKTRARSRLTPDSKPGFADSAIAQIFIENNGLSRLESQGTSLPSTLIDLTGEIAHRLAGREIKQIVEGFPEILLVVILFHIA